MRRPQWWSEHARRMVILWIVFTILGIIATVTVPRMLNGLIPIAAGRTNDYMLTLEVFTILAAPVFMLVMVVALYSLFHGRSPSQPMRDGPALRAGRGVQTIWVVTSVVLVTALFIWGLIFLDRADAAPAPSANVLQVDVTGEQWNWNFTYPQYGNAQSETLEVPVDRPILFKITSIDVDHSFSIPAWGMKEDAVPGEFTYIRVNDPTVMGSYSVRCYELCGMFHAYMEEPVHVVAPSDFTTWVNSQPKGYPWGIAGAGLPGQLQEHQIKQVPVPSPLPSSTLQP